MTSRFKYLGTRVVYRDCIEWGFSDSLLQETVLLAFHLRRRTLEVRKRRVGGWVEVFPAWLPQLEEALPPEELAAAIAFSINRT